MVTISPAQPLANYPPYSDSHLDIMKAKCFSQNDVHYGHLIQYMIWFIIFEVYGNKQVTYNVNVTLYTQQPCSFQEGSL